MPREIPARRNQPVRIFADDSLEIEERAVEALRQIADLDHIVATVVGLPDLNIKLRRGYIAPSGYAVISGKLCPGLMDSRVNCGMLLASTDIEARELSDAAIEAIFDFLRGAIRTAASDVPARNLRLPPGADLLSAGPDRIAAAFDLSDMETGRLEGLVRDADGLLPLDAAAARELPDQVLWAAGRSLGVLGKGNHFAELHEVGELLDIESCGLLGIRRGQIVIAMHSDSVEVGEVARDILLPARKLRRSPGAVARLWARLRGSVPPPSPPDVVPLEGGAETESAAVLVAAAHRFGTVNRLAIYSAIRFALKTAIGRSPCFELLGDFAHDTIFRAAGGQGWEHRKGAVRLRDGAEWPADRALSRTGRIVFVPGALGTRAHIGAAFRPNALAHNSCTHGAGRTLARKDSATKFSDEDVRRELEAAGARVYMLGSGERLAELSRHGFRDPDRVARYMEAAGLIRLIAALRPIAILKG
ncbi:MAG: RtcB family protein [Planctomycetota bacterium]|nr:RtcB family protein [Planctomycetota bacterium]